MKIDAKSQRNQDPASFPSAANHAFSPYMQAFGEFAEPRTIPSSWDLSELMAQDGWSNRQSAQQPGERANKERGER